MFTRNIVRALKAKRFLTESMRRVLEEQALDSPRNAYQYARIIIGGPWPKGEPVIATSPKFSYYYAYNVIQGRFPEGEYELTYSKVWFKEYWFSVLHETWPSPLPATLEIAKERYTLWDEAPSMIAPDFTLEN